MKFLFLLLFHIVFIGCTMHPKYHRPEMEMAKTWREPDLSSNEIANTFWWQQFNDPNIDALVLEALENNQDLKVAIERVNAYEAKLGIVASKLYPDLNATINANRGKLSEESSTFHSEINTTANTYELLLNASYELDIWGHIRSAKEEALHNLIAQVETRRTVVLTLVTDVIASYILLKQFEKQLNIAKLTQKSRESSYSLATTRYQLGLTSEMPVKQALSEVESATNEKIRLEKATYLQEDLISVLLGKPSTKIIKGTPLEDLLLPQSLPSALPSDLLNQRPDILAAEQKLIAKNANIGVAKSLFFPQISLTGLYGTESTELNNLFKKSSNIWQYGASILQEIFTGGRLTSGVKLAKAEKQEAIHSYQSTILNAFKEVNDSIISFYKNIEIAKKQKALVKSLAIYLHLATLRYENGETDYLTVLDAQRKLFSAQLDEAKAIGDTFFAYISVYKSFGGGWVIEADKKLESKQY